MKQDVAQTNALLKSIGAGIDLNLSGVVEKQVRSMLARFKKEIQDAAGQSTKSGGQMASGIRAASTQIQSLITMTQKLGKDGALTETRKGFDDLGRSITEVYKNGQLLHKTVRENSALSKDIQYANQLYQEQAEALTKIYALRTQCLKTQDGTPAAMDLDSQIADTGKLIDANNQLIALLDQQAVSRSKLTRLSAEEAALGARYAAAQASQQERLNAAKAEEQKYASSGLPELQRVHQAYKQLTSSYRQYIAAVKNGNQAGQAYWSQSAQAALAEIASMEQKIGSLTMEEGVRKRTLDLIEQARNAEATHQKALNSINGGASQLNTTLDRMAGRLLQMASTMLVLRGLSSLWQKATDFAQQYYDKLNEIRIVTGKSQAEVNKLGQQYRALAKTMSVSATEIAIAAVEFWRQG